MLAVIEMAGDQKGHLCVKFNTLIQDVQRDGKFSVFHILVG